MKLRVDRPQRLAKMRAHTATHLLHFALEHVLGTTKQAGSLVDCDYVRFDFAAKDPLTQEHLDTIETMVNDWIYQALPVSVTECDLQEAKDLGAKAFFEDKYGDRVRVVAVHGPDSSIPLRSVELCGGTHVSQTDHIGAFVIDSQEAVASGIRRITAYTGKHVRTIAQSRAHTLQGLATIVSCQPKQLAEKIEKLLGENQSLATTLEQLQHTTITSALQKLGSIEHTYFDYIIDCKTCGIDTLEFKTIIATSRQLFQHYNVLVYNSAGAFAVYAGKTNDAKQFAQSMQLRGGGNDALVQGKDTEITSKITL